MRNMREMRQMKRMRRINMGEPREIKSTRKVEQRLGDKEYEGDVAETAVTNGWVHL